MSNSEQDGELLLKAIRAIGRTYDLSVTELSQITGVAVGNLERVDQNERRETLTSDQVQAAQQMLGLYKELTAFFGEDNSAASSWLRTRNLDLDAHPIDLIKTADSIEKVRHYLRDHLSRS